MLAPRIAVAGNDGGKHAGPPDDQPWPVPDEEPSPDGSRPQEPAP
ncbi:MULTISPECIES: hypothetical protein [Streptomyces]|uniref:Uncharacterized protein n=1 Tax=Streptomyces cacaoi TaxID=1898 RepID=A0A4Y3R836_STRCI|nr:MULTISPECIES: hypothetical protein [Streptomyces]GEB53792.1 hypothetical protein SCA03_63430 [Streptomyces cacaoi]